MKGLNFAHRVGDTSIRFALLCTIVGSCRMWLAFEGTENRVTRNCLGNDLGNARNVRFVFVREEITSQKPIDCLYFRYLFASSFVSKRFPTGNEGYPDTAHGFFVFSFFNVFDVFEVSSNSFVRKMWESLVINCDTIQRYEAYYNGKDLKNPTYYAYA